MKRLLSAVCLVVLLAAFSGAQIKWSKDLSASMKVSQKSKRIILVDFYADW